MKFYKLRANSLYKVFGLVLVLHLTRRISVLRHTFVLHPKDLYRDIGNNDGPINTRRLRTSFPHFLSQPISDPYIREIS